MALLARSVVVLFLSIVFASGAHAQQSSQLADFSNTTLGKIAIAVISAVLSLLVGYILLYIKERREPAKRLSYRAEFRKGMLGIEERLSKDLAVTYKGKPAANISYIQCDLLNSGSSVVRNQRLRFEFPKGSEILDYKIDPEPPKEVGLAPFDSGRDDKNEKTFSFLYLERVRKINFHFVVAGDTSSGIQLFGFNEEEDVEVVPGDVGMAADDRKILESVLLIFFMTLFVPHVLFAIPVFGHIAAGVFYLIATIAVLPYLHVVARTFARLITTLTAKRDPTISIDYLSVCPKSS
jgi:hypothetical protein